MTHVFDHQHSQPQITQAGVIRWPGAAAIPMVLPVSLTNWQVVNAGDSTAHKSLLVELPVFIAIGSEPVSRVVVEFVSKTHGDAIVGGDPQLLDQPVV